MASDRARLSSQPGRDYRAVVYQQGRVTLEADANETRDLGEPALRENIIDIVGPAGTPDDGYEVTSTGSGFTVGTGTYYLGGWRVELDAAIPVGGGPDALDITPPQLGNGSYAIALLLTEQEVSAVEDHALLEVALGGPDTTQRTRLMQRAVALATGGESCDSSAAAIDAALKADGATFDPATAAILPTARLRVGLVSAPTPADPCDPPASGGYLGADNQLIRVSVTAYNPVTRTGKLVWGYDNASTLYRCSTSDGQVLTLEGEPVDTDHAPRLDQAVEVLRTRALFDHGDVIAADSGTVTRVTASYDPDLRRVLINGVLPAGERGDATHPLFLRLWEKEIDFTAGTPVELGDTGLSVAVTLDALDTTIVARPYWCFAARPSTPVIVYPRRYLDAPQPPEGPRQWIASLAVGTVAGGKAEVTDDCRETFLPLTKIKPGCCGITLDPDLRGHRDTIQKALDRLRGQRGAVTLRPGRHVLRKPIRLDASHKGLTLEGCSEGVFLEALNPENPDFAQGLIILDDVNEVYLRNLQFQMPITPLDVKKAPMLAAIEKDAAAMTSVGVSATGCAQTVITGCQFRYRLQEGRGLFAIGLLLRGECWGLRLTGNRFLHDVDYKQERTALRLLIGVALVPAIAIDPQRPISRGIKDARIDALLDAGEITGNEFAGLTQAVLVNARLGNIRIERNRIFNCGGGISILDSALSSPLRAFGDGVVLGFPLTLTMLVIQFATIIPGAGGVDPKLTAALIQKQVKASVARSRDLIAAFKGEGQEGDAEVSELANNYLDIAAAIDAKYDPLAAVLHIAGNDIDISGALLRATETQERLATNLAAGPSAISLRQGGAQLLALQVLLEQREEGGGDILVTSNRFASVMSPSVQIGFPHHLVFASNIVKGDGNDEWLALNIQAHPYRSMIEVMANVVDKYVRIFPEERPAPPSQAWQFVNRVY